MKSESAPGRSVATRERAASSKGARELPADGATRMAAFHVEQLMCSALL